MSQESPHEQVLVVGGSHGISFEIIKSLLGRGVAVTCFSRTREHLDQLQGPAEKLLTHHHRDVIESPLESSELPELLHGFVYCPGSINLGPLKSTRPEALRRDFELNAVGALTSFQSAASALRASGCGSAVFFSTVAVNHGIAMHTAIAAAKGALQAMAKTWAAELAPHVRVNCIAPALTDTPLAGNLLASEEKRDAMAAKYPLRRVGKPQDIAAMADFLLSSRSSWITGQTLAVDGGMSSIVSL